MQIKLKTRGNTRHAIPSPKNISVEETRGKFRLRLIVAPRLLLSTRVRAELSPVPQWHTKQIVPYYQKKVETQTGQ